MTLSPVHIKISNFQSIEDIEFEVHGFTLVSGKSNAGKSAIIRAITSALTNAPVGPLVRKGAKYCSVSINTDGWGLVWEKGERGINRYRLDGDNKLLDKVGFGQIDEITKFGFGSVKIGSDSVYPWVAPQFDPLFLLNRSGPAITDFISEVSRLQVLQDAISINIKNKKKSQDEIKIRAENLEKLENKNQLLNNCDGAVSIKNDLEAQVESMNWYEIKILKAVDVDQQLDKVNYTIGMISGVETVAINDIQSNDFATIIDMHRYWTKLENAAKGIISIRDVNMISIPKAEPYDEVKTIADLNILLDRISLSERIVNSFVDVSVPVEEGPSVELLKMDGISTKLDALKGEEGTFSDLLSNISNELEQVEQEMSSIPLCPTCSRPNSHSHSHSH